jgi:hypothetical protein
MFAILDKANRDRGNTYKSHKLDGSQAYDRSVDWTAVIAGATNDRALSIYWAWTDKGPVHIVYTFNAMYSMKNFKYLLHYDKWLITADSDSEKRHPSSRQRGRPTKTRPWLSNSIMRRIWGSLRQTDWRPVEIWLWLWFWVTNCTRVEAGSNTSIVSLRVIGGDKKGNFKSETVKYGRESHGTRIGEWIRWRGPVAVANDRYSLIRKDVI